MTAMPRRNDAICAADRLAMLGRVKGGSAGAAEKGGGDVAKVARQMHAVVHQRVALDADFQKLAGGQVFHRAGPIADHVAAAGLNFRPASGAVSPAALPGAGLGGAGPGCGPFEAGVGLAARAGRAGGQRPLAIQRIGRHELRRLGRCLVQAADGQGGPAQGRKERRAHRSPLSPAAGDFSSSIES